MNGQNKNTLDITRRRFLNWFGTGLAFLVASIAGTVLASIRFLFPNVLYEPPTSFKLGRPEDYGDDSVTPIDEHRIFVLRLKEGIRVVSAVCTHLRCTVNWVPGDKIFHCPCHGSKFNIEGSVIGGPAPRALDWYEVKLGKDGRLIIDTSKIVDSNYILKV